MASDLNKVILIGRMVRDPEIKYLQNGNAVANFSIASSRTYVQAGEKKEIASFFSCVAWTKLGELIVQYVKKGQRLGIEGRLQQRSWEDKDGNKRSTVEIVVDNVQFLEPKRADGESSASIPESDQDIPNVPEVSDNPFSDDDIPF